MRLIDLDYAIQQAQKPSIYDLCDTVDFLKEQPIVDGIHAAGGCYCCECKYSKQNYNEQTKNISYKCTKHSFYDFNDRTPNDFCSHGIKRMSLQQEIFNWLKNRAFFADNISHTEFIMQQIYFDNPMYEGKQEDQQEIANNCITVADAYYYVQTHKLNVNKFYKL